MSSYWSKTDTILKVYKCIGITISQEGTLPNYSSCNQQLLRNSEVVLPAETAHKRVPPCQLRALWRLNCPRTQNIPLEFDSSWEELDSNPRGASCYCLLRAWLYFAPRPEYHMTFVVVLLTRSLWRSNGEENGCEYEGCLGRSEERLFGKS